MMTTSRYLCAVVVLIVASLTPSSCSNVAEPAMAFDEHDAVTTEVVTIERSDDGTVLSVNVASEGDASETGS